MQEKELLPLETLDSYIVQNNMATRQQTILRIGIIGGALLLILVVVIVVRNLSIVRQSASEVEQRDRMLQMVSGSIAVCDDNPYPSACRRRTVNKQAREFKSSEMCVVLEGEERVACVYVVIKETLDVKDCDALDGDERDHCKDQVIRLSAQDSLELALCAGIGNETEKANCETIVTKKIVSSGRCVELGVDPSLCNVREVVSQAVRSMDFDICNDLQGDQKDRCIKEVDLAKQEAQFLEEPEPTPEEPVDGTLDSDFDGITDEDERNVYGTDPFNPDSDNDGFSDKTEIDGGFNPLGSG